MAEFVLWVRLVESGRRARPTGPGVTSNDSAATIRGNGFVRARRPWATLDHPSGLGVGVDRIHALLRWSAGRSFRRGPVVCAVPGGRRMAGPQPNNVCCWQPGLVGSLRSLWLNRLQQKLVR